MKDYEMNGEFESQQKQVRNYLLKGNSITPLEALHKFGSLRLSALIYNLRWEEGFPIITEKIQVSPKKRVAKYYIDPKYLEEYNKNLKK